MRIDPQVKGFFLALLLGSAGGFSTLFFLKLSFHLDANIKRKNTEGRERRGESGTLYTNVHMGCGVKEAAGGAWNAEGPVSGAF